MLRSGSLARFSVLVAAVGLAGAALSPQAAVAGRAAAGPSLDWPQYLHDPQHSSVSAATAFTPLTAASARVVWHWQPPVIAGKQAPFMFASPTVAVGRVYIGTLSGEFYALNEATGAVLWSRLLDTEPKTACGARGIISTAAVQPDPVTGTSTVYASGARYLYALNAATGAMDWKTEIGAPGATSADAYYNWSSPTVVNGHIYVGLSSNCDDPLIRGGVVELDQHTGRVLNTWYSVPAGSIGGSVWSSVAASPDGQDVWASTGSECDPKINTCPPKDQVGHALSIVHLSSSLAQLQTWQLPHATGHDWDFGSSPTLFGSAPAEVGACNKDGAYYTLAANPLSGSPRWADQLGAPPSPSGLCLASAIWNSKAGALYVAGDGTAIGATKYGGSVRRVNPLTGAYLWQTGLPCAVMGTPSLDSAGVIAAATYACPASGTPGAYLINATTGTVLKTLPAGSGPIFGQPVFAQSSLFVATETHGLYDFAP